MNNDTPFVPSRKWHPDRNKDNVEKANKKFTEVGDRFAAAVFESLVVYSRLPLTNGPFEHLGK